MPAMVDSRLCPEATETTIGLPQTTVGELRRFLAAARDLLPKEDPRLGALVRSGARLRDRLAAELCPQARTVLSLHIPKTGGLTFGRVLAAIYREDFYCSYREITNCRGEPLASLPANIRCVHGHIHAEELLERYPAARLVTWVRDPVQRVVSLYHYWRREPDWQHPLCRTLHERRLSLLDFARMEDARNDMSRYFGRLRPEDFSFIGILEELPASMELFFRRFDLRPLPVSHGHRNPVRDTGGYRLGADQWAEIAALNQSDEILYRECLARFQRERDQGDGDGSRVNDRAVF
jgi:hypothetical protein